MANLARPGSPGSLYTLLWCCISFITHQYCWILHKQVKFEIFTKSKLAYVKHLSKLKSWSIQGNNRYLPSSRWSGFSHQNSTLSKYLVPLKELGKRFLSQTLKMQTARTGTVSVTKPEVLQSFPRGYLEFPIKCGFCLESLSTERCSQPVCTEHTDPEHGVRWPSRPCHCPSLSSLPPPCY